MEGRVKSSQQNDRTRKRDQRSNKLLKNNLLTPKYQNLDV
ncbi:hypothetical protein EV05_1828 [Prochlorococcus sp. MIT 0601]|nr:hypothetical protein EV05_1828 [Prochlorococcus sp. MIT 0601]